MTSYKLNQDLFKDGIKFLTNHPFQISKSNSTEILPYIEVNSDYVGLRYCIGQPLITFNPKNIQPNELTLRIIRKAGTLSRLYKSILTVTPISEEQNIQLFTERNKIIAEAIEIITSRYSCLIQHSV
ncbi:MAG: hypothetical protein Q7R95_10410 [bacterium]|nr:hypothetical protein [bacterium]